MNKEVQKMQMPWKCRKWYFLCCSE